MEQKELKNLKIMLTTGVSEKSKKPYSKLDVCLSNGVVICTYWLSDKDLYILNNVR